MSIFQRLYRLGTPVLITLFLVIAGCSDKSEITSGSGTSGVTSDGGSSSARFAGTYTGTTTVMLSGGSISDTTKTREFTMVIRDDGTASLTIGSDTIEGDVSGNKFGFSIGIVEKEDLVDCKGNANLEGTISGRSVSGNISGRGECKVVAARTGIDIVGSLTGRKT